MAKKPRKGRLATAKLLGQAAEWESRLEKLGSKATPCTVKADWGHWAYGYVDTSFKAQSVTKQRTIGAYTEKSLGGVNAAQTYVTLSRGRLSAKLFTNLDRDTLREAIQRQEERKSATELMAEPDKKMTYRETDFARRAMLAFRRKRESERRLQGQELGVTRDIARTRDNYRGHQR